MNDIYRDQFHHNEILAITAYNAGHGQTEKWCEDYHWGHDFSNYSEIPFAETRHYVRRVLDNKMEYEKLYGEADK